MAAGYSSRCKLCKSSHRVDAERWVKEDGLSFREVERRLADMGESISNPAIVRHFREHFDVQAEARDQYEKSKAFLQEAVEKRLSDMEMLDEVIANNHQVNRQTTSWVKKLTKMGKRAPKLPMSLVTLHEKTAAEMRQAIKTKLELLGDDPESKKADAVSSLVDMGKWLEVFVKPKRITTYENYECHIRVHILPALGDHPLQILRPSDLQRFLNGKQTGGRADGKPGGLSTRTVRMLHFVLYAALKQAVKEGLIGKNVAEDVTLPKQGKRKAVYLVTDELQLFIEVAGKSRHFAAIMTELGTGLRRGELLALSWDVVNLEGKTGTVTVKRQLVRTRHGPIFQDEPKTEAGYRTITLPDEVVAILKRHKAAQAQERLICGQAYENNNLVFAQANGRRIEPRNFTAQIDKMMERAGIRHVPFHSLRHSHATELLRMGVDLAVISDRLGHSSFQVTRDFYAHIADELQRDAADKINGLLTGAHRKAPADGTGQVRPVK